MRNRAEIRANRSFPQFDAVEYKIQIVAGRVYFVKVGGAELCYSGVCLLKSDRLASEDFFFNF